LFAVAAIIGSGAVFEPQAAKAGNLQEPGGFTPRVEGEIVFEFQSDNTFDSEDPAAELSDTFNTTEAAVGWYLFPGFSVQAGFVLEPVLDPEPGEDRFFEDHGLYAEELYAQYQRGPVRAFAGKFNPAFGKAWDAAPGIYGTDLAEDYELTERLGLGAEVSQDAGALGALALTAALYQADTSGLSDSAFTNRGRTDCDDGGLSNTCSLESFAVALDGSALPGLPGLGYQLAYRHQAAGDGDPEDENGYSAALTGAHTWNSVGVEWIGEVAYLDGADVFDEAPQEIWYQTFGVAFTKDIYNLSLSYTGRQTDFEDVTEDYDDYQFSVSAGAAWSSGWTFDVGYKYHVEEDVENHTVGALLTRSVGFNTAE
jgi:hypothetical protein